MAIATPAAGTTSRSETTDSGDRALIRAATLFALAVVVHNGDHLRRGVGKLHGDVFAAGMAAIVAEVAIVVLILQRHRFAPAAAAIVGPLLAAGYVETHFLPAHRWLSDSFTSSPHTSPLSWAAASAEVITAIWLGVLAWRVVAHRGGLAALRRPHPGQQRVLVALAHPVVVALVVTQVAAVVVSLVQRVGT